MSTVTDTQTHHPDADKDEHLTLEIVQPPWVKDAVCATVHNPQMFFPRHPTHTIWAQAHCRICPVKQECYDHGQAYRERYPLMPLGIRGGINLDEHLHAVTTHPLGRTYKLPQRYLDQQPPPPWKKQHKTVKVRDCIWCGNPYRTTESRRQMHCSEKCIKQTEQNITVTGPDGQRHKYCHQCNQTKPVTYYKPDPHHDNHKGSTYHRYDLCIDCARPRTKERPTQPKPPPRECLTCATIIWPRNPGHKYCSRTCQGKARQIATTRQCIECDTPFKLPYRNSNRRFCSRECYDRDRGAEPLPPISTQLPCLYCHQPYEYQIRQTHKCCSNQCAHLYRMSQRPINTCENCRSQFVVSKPNTNKTMRRYCTPTCRKTQPPATSVS